MEDAAAAARLATLPPALVKWVGPAPGKHAKAYASRINDLFGGQRSVGELLFLTEPTQLNVCIEAAFDHSTLSALQIMRLVDIVAINRKGARRQPDIEASTKVQMGDELTLRAAPHVLAAVAMSKGGKLVLAPKPTREKLSRQIKAERTALLAAAEALQAKVLPLVRARLGAIRELNRLRAAVTRLQCAWRGRRDRQALGPKLEGQRARKRAAKLRSKKLLAGLIHQQHLEPVYTESRLDAEAEAERVAAAREVRTRWREANGVVAGWYEQLATVSKAHTGALNRAVAAAPESTKKKLSARRLARTPLNLLLSSGVELTAAVDQSGNNMTVKGLGLPKVLNVSKVTVNGKVVVAKRPGALDPTKVLHGDTITLKGLPHAIASVTEIKGNRLTLMPMKARKEAAAGAGGEGGGGSALGAALQRDRSVLLAAAERLARRLQRLVRTRLELRAHHRRSHAALVVQIAWACYYAEHVQPRVAMRMEAEAEGNAKEAAVKAAAAKEARMAEEARMTQAAKAAEEAKATAEAKAMVEAKAMLKATAAEEEEAAVKAKAAEEKEATVEVPTVMMTEGAPVAEAAAVVAAPAMALANETEKSKESEVAAKAKAADDEWYVECFMARRRLRPEYTKSGKAEWEYLIRWIGKGPEEDRWVPESALDPSLIEAELAEASNPQPAPTPGPDAAMVAEAAASVTDELARYAAAVAAVAPGPPPAVATMAESDSAMDGSNRDPSPTGSDDRSALASPASSSSEADTIDIAAQPTAGTSAASDKLLPGAWLGADSKAALANGAMGMLSKVRASKLAAATDADESEDGDEVEEEDSDASRWMAEAFGRRPIALAT